MGFHRPIQRVESTRIHAAVDGIISVKRADLSLTDLQGADLSGANLQRANLSEANLQGANLVSANLTKAMSLTRKQLDEACGDDKTKLPDYLADYQMKPCPTPEPTP